MFLTLNTVNANKVCLCYQNIYIITSEIILRIPTNVTFLKDINKMTLVTRMFQIWKPESSVTILISSEIQHFLFSHIKIIFSYIVNIFQNTFQRKHFLLNWRSFLSFAHLFQCLPLILFPPSFTYVLPILSRKKRNCFLLTQ